MSMRVKKFAALVILLSAFALAATTLVDLTANVKGTLPTLNGGTGQSTSNTVAFLETANAYTAAQSFFDTKNSKGEGSTTGSAAINTTETAVVVSTTAMAVSRFNTASVIHIYASGTCTTTVANTSTFKVRIGTAGTTADGVLATVTTSVAGTTGTNIPFFITFDIVVKTTGGSATADGTFQLISNGQTGISAQAGPQILSPTMSTFNTAASNKITLTYSSAAATTTSTFKVAYIILAEN